VSAELRDDGARLIPWAVRYTCGVAGFDFEFIYTRAQEPIAQACQAAARSRARRLGISWKWRTLALRHVVVVVDGTPAAQTSSAID
jgi:hypothetical protein